MVKPRYFYLIFIFREEEDQHINLLRYQLYGGDNLDESKEEPKIIRAHPVPLESQLPLFDKIMAEQEHRYSCSYLVHLNSLMNLITGFTSKKRNIL
jgi:hypothetical protein